MPSEPQTLLLVRQNPSNCRANASNPTAKASIASRKPSNQYANSRRGVLSLPRSDDLNILPLATCAESSRANAPREKLLFVERSLANWRQFGVLLDWSDETAT
jgi:hypothetical protein